MMKRHDGRGKGLVLSLLGGIFTTVLATGLPAGAQIPINDLSELALIGDPAYPSYPLNGIYVLTTDIDASSTEWWNEGAGFLPIGTSDRPFTGVFDGGGHVIRNLTINRPVANNVGFFGAVDDGIIRNLGLENVSVRGYGSTGGLVGYLMSSGRCENCYVTGQVRGRFFTGGLVGISWYGEVTNCYAACSVRGAAMVGGLTGFADSVTFSDSYAAGNVIVSSYVGGAVGFQNYGTLRRIYSAAKGKVGTRWVDWSDTSSMERFPNATGIWRLPDRVLRVGEPD